MEPVGTYYGVGLGGYRSGPGPNYGVSFGPDSLALTSQAAGGSGNFDVAPTMLTSLYFLSGPSDIMNVPGGFMTGISL